MHQQKSAPLTERIRDWAHEQRVPRGNVFRKSIEYILNLWAGLTVFLTQPRCRWTITTSNTSCVTW
jgi:transposase